MRYVIRGFGALVCAAALASCGSIGGKQDSGLDSASSDGSNQPSSVGITDDVVKLGASYVIAGTSYTPVDSATYDEVGYASIYGREMAGKSTANGEIFRPTGASAAHKTLPMPSYVEVTALNTGRTILVRINDRGPFANDRLIDLSEGAARQLGLSPQDIFGVRVRRVNPPEQEKTLLRQGMMATERIETPAPLLKVLRDKLAKLPRPTGVAAVQPAPMAGKPMPLETPSKTANDGFIREGEKEPKRKGAQTSAQPAVSRDYVAQIGAFSSPSRADALARKVGGRVTASADGRLFRVRLGPYATEGEAVRAAKQKGYPQARIYRD